MLERDDDPAFAGQMGFSGVKSSDPIDRLPSQAVTTDAVRHDLDSDKAKTLFDSLIGHYRRELYRQNENRSEQSMDADFYDGDQYSAEDVATLKARGQEPLVYNVIATTINWLAGTEKRGRTDYKILPRREDGAKGAERKTQLFKYLSDVNRTEFHTSRSFMDTIKIGVGWLEAGVQADDEGEPIYDRYESWRNMVWDSAATELDLSDGRYIFRSKWSDVDTAKDFTDRKRHWVIDKAANTSFDLLRALEGYGDEAMDAAEEEQQEPGWSFDGTATADRSRVRLIEAWFRKPSEDQYMSGGQFTGELFDHQSQGHMRDLERGDATLQRRVRMRMHVAILTEAGMLHVSKSPYRHNQFPFTPIWCYRRDRNNLPYGVVRQLRGPQMDINKRVSKALFILSSNKVIMDRGAVKDMDKFAEEAARPDGIIVKEAGKHLEFGVDRELAPAHLDLMARSIEMVQQVGGVTDESLGRTTNATSGKAITARQDQGALATATIFDNLRLARQIHGEKLLSLTEQFMDKKKQFRITDQRGRPEYITINDGLPENDIVSSKADFVVSEEDFNATIRQAQVAELLELMQMLATTAPEIVMTTLDLVIETMDVPQRDELVKRIRQLTGMTDPDADPNAPDPETIAMQEQKAKQQEMQARMAEAEVVEKEASAAEKQAKATKTQSEAARVQAEVARILAQTTGEKVETQVRALEAAAAIIGGQGLAPVADAVLAESGGLDGQGPAPSANPPPEEAQGGALLP